jgi:hypothetical protein
MISWTNFLNRRRSRQAVLVLALALTGCASRGGVPAEPLAVRLVAAAQPVPLTAGRAALSVRAVVSGADPATVRYRLLSEKEGQSLEEAGGPQAAWQWRPKMPGTYRLRVGALAADGRQAVSAWSRPYQVEPALDTHTLVAVLPPDNLSGGPAPLADIHAALGRQLAALGVRLLEPEILAAFMKEHRMRHTGGLSAELAMALRRETGVEAVLITAVESWQESGEPKVALLARLVLTTDLPEIAWMDSVGIAGHERPGLLGLGRITTTAAALTAALEGLTASLERYMAGQHRSQRGTRRRPGREAAGDTPVLPAQFSADAAGPGPSGGHAPRSSHRAADFAPERPYTVAVVPFLNIDARKDAGAVLALHFVKALHRYENIHVLEPGVVRQTLLKYRMIMAAGPSLAVSDVLASPAILGADLVLSGKVFDYQGESGASKVDFSVQIFDGPGRAVVWNSRSYATGLDRVYFFNVGRIASAHGLASRLAGQACDVFMQ